MGAVAERLEDSDYAAAIEGTRNMPGSSGGKFRGAGFLSYYRDIESPDLEDIAVAQKVVTELIDDIDESPADRTFTFAIENRAFQVDLSVANIAAFHEAVSRFVESARPAGKVTAVAKGGGNGRARMDREQTQAIREWARARGYSVSNRGRISAEIMAAYNAGSPAATG